MAKSPKENPKTDKALEELPTVVDGAFVGIILRTSLLLNRSPLRRAKFPEADIRVLTFPSHE